jgi:hypothetical protein
MARLALTDPAGAGDDTRRALAFYEGLASRSAENSFGTACCHGALAGLAGQQGSRVSAAEALNEADVAMDPLRKAVTLGYRNAGAFRTVDALDSLCGRDDFRLLLMDPAMPAEPFARTHPPPCPPSIRPRLICPLGEDDGAAHEYNQ